MAIFYPPSIRKPRSYNRFIFLSDRRIYLVAPKPLFTKHDIYTVVENQKQRVKDAFERLSDLDAMDETVTEKLKNDYSLMVPVLKVDDQYASHQKVKVDARNQIGRLILDKSRPIMEGATEITVHIPFDGDPGIFNVAPSASNSTVAVGEVIDQELHLVFTVTRPDFDLPGYVKREISQIEWRLNNLRFNADTFNTELERDLKTYIAKRKKKIEEHDSIVGNLGIPVRQAPVLASSTPQVRATASTLKAAAPARKWDVFISHASEDKDAIARPLAEAFRARGMEVWYDEYTLRVGDSLRKSIDTGLAGCKFGVVILSPYFFNKHWPEQELNGLANREVHGKKVILPIWHNINHYDVSAFSPTLADRVGVPSTRGLEHVVDELMLAMQ
jgi:TIR domain